MKQLRLYHGLIHVKEITASNGDLVDVEFRCDECFTGSHIGYEYWYADYRDSYPGDFSTDYPTYCKGCDLELIDIEGHC